LTSRARGASAPALVRRSLAFLLPGLPLGLLNLAVNHARFGAWLETGYANQGAIVAGVGHLPDGLFGLLLRPGQGPPWYSPTLAAGPFAWRAFHRRDPEVARLAAGAVALTLGLFAPLWWWHGDWAWGPRYLVLVLPVLVLPLAEWLDDP